MKDKEIPVEITYYYLNGTSDDPPRVAIKMKLDPTYCDVGYHNNNVILNGCKCYAISFISCSELNDVYIAERLDEMYKECCEVFLKLKKGLL